MRFLKSVAVVGLLAAAPAFANVNNFDAVGPNQHIGAYTEDGITAACGFTPDPQCPLFAGIVPGSADLDTYTLVVSLASGLFNLQSITIASRELGSGQFPSVELSLRDAGGNFTRQETVSFQTNTVSFTGWTGLAKLYLVGNTNGVSLDSITLAPVPEPATWAMALSGLLLIGCMKARRVRL